MYDFDEQSWDDQASDDQACFDQNDWKVTQGGYLIQRLTPLDLDLNQAPDAAESSVAEYRFLQIGTGQWCSAVHATVFPQPSTAEAYAWEFGYVIGRHARVVHRRF
ncbi:hypothetical protein K227x_55490 [Rubripirellula lacrimiformis]|uniref:Uncharacterized protein n=1 Tax=Rubripirellula lacrimiformis TaxID=1930273 RepID=A0A517NJ19_9BACT|nr:hypothetical protein [Rubripirellula lacrimiformis]QDT07124.1 hypothetical protein K227x_55490 [Rubripirellula lacrimiformis]